MTLENYVFRNDIHSFQSQRMNRSFLDIHKTVVVAAVACSWLLEHEDDAIVHDRHGNRTTGVDYDLVVLIIVRLKTNNPSLFTRMFRLSPSSFDRILSIIEDDLKPSGPGGRNIVPPMIKLCLALRFLAGGSYLDLHVAYHVPHNAIHHYVWQAIIAIDKSIHPFLNNIKSPIQASAEELEVLEDGFARLSGYRLRGTVAAGDGVVFRMVMPTNEEVDGDVTSYFTRKGYYAYGLQVSYSRKTKLYFIECSNNCCLIH